MTDALTFALLSAVLVGVMLFFAAVVAPLVFAQLDEATAGRFIRRIFPVYYLAGFALAGLAALCAAVAPRPVDAGGLAVVAGLFLLARQGLMPRINALRDRELAGETAAGPRFARLHRLSVWINGAQLLAAAAVAVRLTLAA